MFEGVADVAWMSLGNCSRLDDASIMFPRGRPSRRAIATCATCPVLRRCRRHHDEIEGKNDQSDLAGFVAGEGPADRIARRTRQRVIA